MNGWQTMVTLLAVIAALTTMCTNDRAIQLDPFQWACAERAMVKRDRIISKWGATIPVSELECVVWKKL